MMKLRSIQQRLLWVLLPLLAQLFSNSIGIATATATATEVDGGCLAEKPPTSIEIPEVHHNNNQHNSVNEKNQVDSNSDDESDNQEEDYNEDTAQQQQQQYEYDDYFPPESHRTTPQRERQQRVIQIWQSGGMHEIYDIALQCHVVKQDPSGLKSPVPSQEDWQVYQDTYRDVMAHTASDGSGGTVSRIPGPGFSPTAIRVPFEVQYTPDAGRGIFTLAKIPQGTLVWDTTNTAAFADAHQYRQFLRELPRPLSCDLIDWAYTRRDASGRPVVCADLDQGSLMNSDDTDPNIGFAKGAKEQLTGCDMEFYALRDIEAGEELRVAYDDFTDAIMWQEMGLGNW